MNSSKPFRTVSNYFLENSFEPLRTVSNYSLATYIFIYIYNYIYYIYVYGCISYYPFAILSHQMYSKSCISTNVHFWLKFHSCNLLSHGTRYLWMTGSVTHRYEIPKCDYLIAKCWDINLVSCMCKYGLSLHNHFVLCLGLDQMDPNGTWNLCLVSFVWPNMRAQWVGIQNN